MVAKERQGKAIVLVCAQCGHPLPIPKADDPNKPHWSWGLLLVGITLLGGLLVFLGAVNDQEEPRRPQTTSGSHNPGAGSAVVNRSMRTLGIKLPLREGEQGNHQQH